MPPFALHLKADFFFAFFHLPADGMPDAQHRLVNGKSWEFEELTCDALYARTVWRDLLLKWGGPSHYGQRSRRHATARRG